MTELATGESLAVVLAKARAAGFEIAEDQVRRQHRADLIPRPKQEWSERVAGSQTIYPIGTGDQLCALCTIQHENRSSAMNWGWKLWWLGFPVSDKYWRLKLKAQAKLIDKTSKEFIRLLGSDQSDACYEEAVESLRNGRTRNVSFRRLRRRLGRRHFEGMLSLVHQILGRDFAGWSIAPGDDADGLRDRTMVERCFGLSRAKNDNEMARDPSMHDDVEDVLHLLSRQLGNTKMTSVLNASSVVNIAEALTQLRVILFTVNGADESSSMLARYGIRVLKELARRMSPGDQATMLIYLLALNRNPEFRKNLAIFLLALRRHVPKAISDAEIARLRSRDPAICSFAFPN